jgi:hypothetical protein
MLVLAWDRLGRLLVTVYPLLHFHTSSISGFALMDLFRRRDLSIGEGGMAATDPDHPRIPGH